jgi:hypothetical protein
MPIAANIAAAPTRTQTAGCDASAPPVSDGHQRACSAAPSPLRNPGVTLSAPCALTGGTGLSHRTSRFVGVQAGGQGPMRV